MECGVGVGVGCVLRKVSNVSLASQCLVGMSMSHVHVSVWWHVHGRSWTAALRAFSGCLPLSVVRQASEPRSVFLEAFLGALSFLLATKTVAPSKWPVANQRRARAMLPTPSLHVHTTQQPAASSQPPNNRQTTSTMSPSARYTPNSALLESSISWWLWPFSSCAKPFGWISGSMVWCARA